MAKFHPLKEVRLNATITQVQLVKEAGITRPTLERAEAGLPIRYINAVKIVRALNKLTGDDHTVESLNIVTDE
jgi:DNA-binding XRE family transcriptional regulator